MGRHHIPEVTSRYVHRERPSTLSLPIESSQGQTDVETNSSLEDDTIIHPSRYIEIQRNRNRPQHEVWGINPTNSVFIPQSLILRSVVLG